MRSLDVLQELWCAFCGEAIEDDESAIGEDTGEWIADAFGQRKARRIKF